MKLLNFLRRFYSIKKSLLFELLFIFLLSLTPLLWYHTPSSLAVGHDLFFPLDPTENFLDRIQLWSTRYAFGINQMQDLSALPIHALDAFIYSLGFSVQTTQKIVFIFWFLMPGFAAYYLARVIGPNSTFFRLFVATFYMFNHFMLQGWFIAERTKFSIVVAAPFVLAFLIQAFEGRMKLPLALSFIGLTLFFFDGGSSPLYGGLLLSVLTAFVYFGIVDDVFSSWEKIKRYFSLAVGFLLVFFTVNLYWILPLIDFSKVSYSSILGGIGGITGVFSWIDVISKNTSIINLLRLQGFPDWDLVHPYAGTFLQNNYLIFASFLLPFFAFLPVFFEKRQEVRRYVLYYSLLALVSIIFVGGSHPPFGGIFNAFIHFIPGFAIFRTPFYKFAPALWLSYAFLLAFSLSYLHSKVQKRSSILVNVIGILSIMGILFYNYPFFTGSFFHWQPPLSTMVDIPSYIYEFRDWVNTQNDLKGKILFLPPLNRDWKADIYTWNYWSFSSVPSLFMNKDVVLNDHSIDSSTQAMLDAFYKSLKEDDPSWKNINKYLGVKYAVLRDDFRSDVKPYQTDKVDGYKEVITNNFTYVRSFGKWHLYEIKDENFPAVYVARSPINIYHVFTSEKLIEQPEKIVGGATFSSHDLFFLNEESKHANLLPTFVFAQCETCFHLLPVSLEIYRPIILPNSIFYFFIQAQEEKTRRLYSADPEKFINFYIGLSIKRISELQGLMEMDQRVNHSLITETFREHNALIREIDRLLISVPSKMEKERLTKRTITLLEQENKLFLKMESQKFEQEIKTTVDLLTKVYTKHIKHMYPLEDSRERRYSLSIPSDSTYELLTENLGIDRGDSVDIVINGTRYQRKAEYSNELLSLGDVRLQKGKNSVNIFLTQLGNIAPFQEITLPFKRGESACREYEITNFFPGRRYAFIFLHRISQADVLNTPLRIDQYDHFNNKKSTDYSFKAYSSFNQRNFVIDVHKDTQRITMAICAPSYTIGEDFTMEFKDIQIFQFAFPNVLAKKKSPKAVRMSLPNISVQKTSEVSYTITVSSATAPYYLVFPQRYDRGWSLFDENGNVIPNHLLANLFSNAWYVDKKGDYTLILMFTPQKKQYIYYAISLISVVVFTGVILYPVLRKYGRKN